MKSMQKIIPMMFTNWTTHMKITWKNIKTMVIFKSSRQVKYLTNPMIHRHKAHKMISPVSIENISS